MSLSVIILAFNEIQNIESSLKEIENELSKVGQPYEIIVIDDGSADGTGEFADNYARNNRFARVVHHSSNLGIGEGYRTGFSIARNDYVTFFPADGQFPASIIMKFALLMDNSDMVLGYIQNRKRSTLASIFSIAEKLLYRLLFGPLPKFQGILMLRRKILGEIELKSSGRGWGVLLELIIRAQRNGYRIVSTPIEFRQRLSGKSKVNNLRTIFSNFWQACRLRMILS